MNETGKRQRMVMHWSDYVRFFPGAVKDWVGYRFTKHIRSNRWR